MANDGVDAEQPAEFGELTSLFNVFVAAREASQLIGDAMKDTEMNPNDYGLISAIIVHGGSSASELAALVSMPLTTFSDWMHGAGARGWIRIEPGVTDRRRRELHITPAGLTAARAAREAFGRAYLAYVRNTSVPEREIQDSLAAMTAGIRAAHRVLAGGDGVLET